MNFLVLALAYPMYLHYLGYSTYGLWLALGTVLAFAQMGDLGVKVGVTKLIAEEYGKKNMRGIEKYLRSALFALMVSGTLILGAIILLRPQIIALFRFEGAQSDAARWLLPALGGISLYVLIVQAFKGVLSGIGRIDLLNYVETFGRVLTVGVSLFFLQRGMGLKALLIGTAVSCAVQHGVTIYMIRRSIPVNLLRVEAVDLAYVRKLMRFSLTVFTGSVSSMLLDPFNRLILSRYVGLSSVPVYDMAYRGTWQLRSLANAGLRALMPEISRMSAGPGRLSRPRIAGLFKKSSLLMILAGTPVYILIFVYARPILELWLRDRFTETLPTALRIMLLGSYMSFLSIPGYYVLIGMGKVRDCLVGHVTLTGSAMLVVLLALFSPVKLEVRVVCLAMFSGFTLATIWLLWRTHMALRPPAGGNRLET